MGKIDFNDLIELVKSTELTATQVKKALRVAERVKSAELAYEIACNEEVGRKRAEEIVLKIANPKFNYLFARDIPNANVNAHQNVLISRKAYSELCDFAGDVADADVFGIMDIILATKNPELAYKFAKCVDLHFFIKNRLIKKDAKLQKMIDSDEFKNAKKNFKTKSTILGKQMRAELKTNSERKNEIEAEYKNKKLEAKVLTIEQVLNNKLADIVKQSNNFSTIFGFMEMELAGVDPKSLSLAIARCAKSKKHDEKQEKTEDLTK